MDFEAMHFSLKSPMQMATRVDEHARITRKGIKEIASLVVQGHLHSRLTNGLKVEEIIKVNNKWETSEKSIGKTYVF